MSISIAHNIDCEKFMAGCKDKEFDLACVDPPYFNGPELGNFYHGGNSKKKITYREVSTWKIPNNEYYQELCRISKHQIIWGINYFTEFVGVPVGRNIWIKNNQQSTFSDCEIASNSLIQSVKSFTYTWDGFRQETGKEKEMKIHPTQKPVALYKWLFHNYAKPGWKILDTHLGSGSSRIAAYEMGLDFYACELDTDYFNDQEKRFAEYLKYRELNTPDFLPEIKQEIQGAAFKEVDLLL